MKAEFIYNGPDLGGHAHCGSLIQLSNGDLLCSWYAYPGDHDYQDGEIALARRNSAASSWGEGKSVFGKFGSSAGNPVIFEDSKNGVVWMLFVLLKGSYWNDSILHLSKSEDAGYSWSQPVLLSDRKGLMVRHTPVELEPGVFMIPAYDECSNHPLFPIFDNGELYIQNELKDTNVIQPDLVMEKSGRLTALFRPAQDPRIVWRVHSTDHGKSWSTVIQTLLPCPLSGVSAFAVGDSIGAVYNNSKEKRFPLSISLSSDGGVGWGEPVEVDSSTHEVSYPSFFAPNDREVYGVFTFNRRMLRFVEFTKSELEDGTG